MGRKHKTHSRHTARNQQARTTEVPNKQEEEEAAEKSQKVKNSPAKEVPKEEVASSEAKGTAQPPQIPQGAWQQPLLDNQQQQVAQAVAEPPQVPQASWQPEVPEDMPQQQTQLAPQATAQPPQQEVPQVVWQSTMPIGLCDITHQPSQQVTQPSILADTPQEPPLASQATAEPQQQVPQVSWQSAMPMGLLDFAQHLQFGSQEPVDNLQQLPEQVTETTAHPRQEQVPQAVWQSKMPIGLLDPTIRRPQRVTQVPVDMPQQETQLAPEATAQTRQQVPQVVWQNRIPIGHYDMIQQPPHFVVQARAPSPQVVWQNIELLNRFNMAAPPRQPFPQTNVHVNTPQQLPQPSTQKTAQPRKVPDAVWQTAIPFLLGMLHQRPQLATQYMMPVRPLAITQPPPPLFTQNAVPLTDVPQFQPVVPQTASQTPQFPLEDWQEMKTSLEMTEQPPQATGQDDNTMVENPQHPPQEIEQFVRDDSQQLRPKDWCQICGDTLPPAEEDLVLCDTCADRHPGFVFMTRRQIFHHFVRKSYRYQMRRERRK